MDEALTEDALLDGRVRLLQPAEGYRAAIDPVLLAAAMRAEAGETVLDAGCGAGAASLCLAARQPFCPVTGIENDPAQLDLARRNIALNKMEGRIEALAGNLADPPPGLPRQGFDHAMTNPPYNAEGTPSPRASKRAANREGELDLAGWVRACLALVRPKGTLTLIHRADRLDELLAALAGRAGSVAVLPLWPKSGRPAKRILLRARKGAAGALTLHPGLVLHAEDGSFTPAADSVLRGAAALEF